MPAGAAARYRRAPASAGPCSYDDKNSKIRIAKGARKRGPFAPIEEAIAAIRAGRMIIVVDDEDRENEGDLTIAAAKVTPEAINFMATHGRGQICLSMTRRAARRSSRFRSRSATNTTPFGTPRSACRSTPRAARHAPASRPPIAPRTVLAAIDPTTTAVGSGAARPHVLRCARATAACWCAPGRPRRPSIWRASPVSYPAGVICEIMNEDGTMARVPELTKFAKKHGLLMITIADLIQYRMRTERLVKRVGDAPSCRPSTARSASSPTRTSSTTRRTSRWCAARSATARTCSSACTRSA